MVQEGTLDYMENCTMCFHELLILCELLHKFNMIPDKISMALWLLKNCF